MNIQEFIERLPKDGWTLDGRGLLQRDGLCPIQVNERRKNIDYADPAEDAGLSNEQVGIILNAAHGMYSPAEWMRNIRVWLLRRSLIRKLI
jgi:hypothetical protein